MNKLEDYKKACTTVWERLDKKTMGRKQAQLTTESILNNLELNYSKKRYESFTAYYVEVDTTVGGTLDIYLNYQGKTLFVSHQG